MVRLILPSHSLVRVNFLHFLLRTLMNTKHIELLIYWPFGSRAKVFTCVKKNYDSGAEIWLTSLV